MSNIELDELPKSKEFMKHAKIADGLTKETGLEHGFLFCKPNDEIIVDKMCVGTECSIGIGAEKCGNLSDTYHTHPSGIFSDFSLPDVAMTIAKAHKTKRAAIECVKSVDNEFILCEKVESEQDKRKMDKMIDIAHAFNNKKITEDEALDIIYKTFEVSSIDFSIEDGRRQTYADMLKKSLE